MRRALPIHVAIVSLFLGLSSSASYAQTREDATVNAATAVLKENMAIPANRIPASLLANARGVAIIPNVVKGGLIVGVRRGHGVLLVRGDDGAWTAPSFITLTGGSVGWQIGVQSTDVILVFKTRKSINGVMQNKFTIGVDAAVAAGPVGRNAAIATDASLKAEILSYSRSRGLFAGVALDGSAIEVDRAETQAYYQRTPGNALPASAARLLESLTTYSAPTEIAAAVPGAIVVPEGTPVVGAPLQPTAPTRSDAIRSDLVADAQKLQGLLDANWRAYLALPAEVYGTGQHANVDVLRAVEARYAATAQNPSYATLTRRPEFQATYAQLQRYLKSQQALVPTKLQLPPPPSGVNTQRGLDR